MRKLMILLLGAILIGILSYFCFLDKAGGIKDDLVSKAQSAYAVKQMNWVNAGIKGDGLGMTRILTLTGTAPSAALKAEAARVALAQDGVYGVDNRLVIDNNTAAKVPEPLPVVPINIKPESEPLPVIVPVDVEIVQKPEPIPIIDVEVPAKVLFSCQDEFKKILSSEKIHFEYNKADVKSKSYKLLNSLADAVKKCSNEIVTISGHTDWDGSKSYNAKLSLNRANSVKKYLVSKGISKNRLITIGHGESKPIASNRTKDGKSKNRRIEFNIKGVK